MYSKTVAKVVVQLVPITRNFLSPLRLGPSQDFLWGRRVRDVSPIIPTRVGVGRTHKIFLRFCGTNLSTTLATTLEYIVRGRWDVEYRTVVVVLPLKISICTTLAMSILSSIARFLNLCIPPLRAVFIPIFFAAFSNVNELRLMQKSSRLVQPLNMSK